MLYYSEGSQTAPAENLMPVESARERQLAAIMFTDMVGYTAMSQADEAHAMDLLEEHRRILRPLFPLHGGTEIKTIGDAFLVEFKSALDATLCAADIQARLREHNLGSGPDRRIEVRIGVHVGDVIHSSGDVYGDAVNIASRIEPLAEPEGICLTQQVYDQVRNKTDLIFQKVGERELKNVDLPVAIYKIGVPLERHAKSTKQAPRSRLAVLPFVNISPDPNDEFFADGLTEEMITKLSEIGGLKVIARTSVMNYKRKEKNAAEIGRELEVGSIIEGSVRKAGNRIRVTVQLVDARTEEHLWASNYDKELDDIFAIQTDVASRVAGSLSSGVFSKPQNDTDDVEAYTFYIRAMQLYHEGKEPSLKEAVEILERAISKDPGFVRAFAALSQVWARMGEQGYHDYSDVTRRAEWAARRALELGPDMAEPHAAMAEVAYMTDRFDESISEAEEAVGINPSMASAYLSMGIVQSSMGRLDQGLASCEKAFELDPLSVHTGGILALVCRAAGRYERALAVLEKMRDLNPRNGLVYCGFAEYHIQLGDFGKAKEMLEKGRQFNADEHLLMLNQAILDVYTGNQQGAEERLGTLMKAKSDGARLYAQLFISAAQGKVDEAFKALDRQADIHAWPFLIKSMPSFEALRKDRRFSEFCKKVGLPP